MEVTLNTELTFAKELTEEDITPVCGSAEETIANELSIPEEYVECQMYKTTEGSRARRLLEISYIMEITINIPAADLSDVVNEDETILQLSNPTNSGQTADAFASLLSSIPELTEANGGAPVAVSLEVQLINIPGSLNDVACAKYGCFGGCYHSKKKNSHDFGNKGTCRNGLNGRKGSPGECMKKGDIWCDKLNP